MGQKFEDRFIATNIKFLTEQKLITFIPSLIPCKFKYLIFLCLK
jgi:hypothetical protein